MYNMHNCSCELTSSGMSLRDDFYRTRKKCFVILCLDYIEDRKKGFGRDRGRDST